VEAALALVVVAASALLATFPLPPARLQEAEAARAGPSAARALPAAGDVLVGLTLRPGQPGRNTAWLYVLPIGGEPEASGLQVTVAAGGKPRPVRRCGPACRSADVVVQGGERLSVHVSGAGGGMAAFTVPVLPVPDGTALLARAQERMHELRTYRLEETLRPALAPLPVAFAFEAPDRLSYQVGGGAYTVIVGPTQYSRAGPNTPWRAQPLPPVQVPSFVWDAAVAVSPRLVGTSDKGGAALQEVAFYEDLDGVPVWFQLGVDDQGLVERADMRAQAHFMSDRYQDFDAPLTIAAPTGE